MIRVTTYLIALFALMATSIVAHAAKPAATTQQFEPKTVSGTIMDAKEVIIDDMNDTDPNNDKKQLKIRFKQDDGNTVILTICNKECWSDFAAQGACVVCSNCLYDICKDALLNPNSNDIGKRAKFTYVETKGTKYVWAECLPEDPGNPAFTKCHVPPYPPMWCRCYEVLE